MPYIPVLASANAFSPQETQDLIRELNLLRQELDEIRANYNAVLAKLDLDAGVTDANYASLYGLVNTGSSVTAAATFTRRLTPT